eukprot:scaffold373_cov350-Pavlova_lutheri.AAC.45
MELRCNINCCRRKRERRTTFLGVPPNGLEHRNDTNVRANEHERTSTPSPASWARQGRRKGPSPLVRGLLLSLFSLALKEPWPAWEARTDVLERPGDVFPCVGQGRRRRRVAHLAWQVEEVYHKAKRDQGSTSLTASHWRLEWGQLGCHGSPRAP